MISTLMIASAAMSLSSVSVIGNALRLRRVRTAPGTRGGERNAGTARPAARVASANRRATAPFGIAGGGAGKPGRNAVRRADGRVEELPATAQVEVAAGDAFIIETPGGGGFGKRRD